MVVESSTEGWLTVCATVASKGWITIIKERACFVLAGAEPHARKVIPALQSTRGFRGWGGVQDTGIDNMLRCDTCLPHRAKSRRGPLRYPTCRAAISLPLRAYSLRWSRAAFKNRPKNAGQTRPTANRRFKQNIEERRFRFEPQLVIAPRLRLYRKPTKTGLWHDISPGF